MPYKAEYIWIDGTGPTAKLRSKTKILADGAEPPIWGFDGSSTNQAEGHASDRVLKPVASFPDPIRGGDDVLVLCEVLNTDNTPHESNTRAALREVAERLRRTRSHCSASSRSTRSSWAPDRWASPRAAYPAPQGGYYCGVGADEIFGRADRREAPGELPGRWPCHLRHQRRGHARPVGVPGRTARARWRSPTSSGWRAGCSTAPPRTFGLSATLDPKPAKGDWNGAGAHTNFSTKGMREDYAAIIEAARGSGP